jgi:hypothetical protein
MSGRVYNPPHQYRIRRENESRKRRKSQRHGPSLREVMRRIFILANSQKRKLVEVTTSENLSTATGDPAALADYLAGYKKSYKQASELELADMRISGMASHTFEEPTDVHIKYNRACLGRHIFFYSTANCGYPLRLH